MRPDDDYEEGDDEPMSYVPLGRRIGFSLAPQVPVQSVERSRFNGDWVDRGRHQLEVMLLILSLKKLALDRPENGHIVVT